MRAKLADMTGHGLGRLGGIAATFAAAWLLAACQSLPSLSPPGPLATSITSNQNIAIQSGTGRPVIVAISGVGAGSYVTLATSSNDVFANLGNGNHTVLSGGDIGDFFQVVLVSAGPGLNCAPSVSAGLLTAAAQTIAMRCELHLMFDNAQSATWVIGQPDFTSTAQGQGANGLKAPAGAAYAPSTGYLYVTDYGNNRVPAFTLPTAPGPNAAFVLGTQNAFTLPTRVSVNGNLMVVANDGASQVWLYSSIPTTDQQPDTIIGQTPGQCLPSSFNLPSSAVITDSGRLLVVDRNNHRVLLYNATHALGVAIPSIVLGQTSMYQCQANQGASAPTASTLSQPDDVWSDDNTIVVSDSYNNRLLFWDTWPTSNGAPATWVFGQPDLLSNQAATSPNGLTQPRGVVSDGTTVYVADYGNSRVLGFSFPTPASPMGMAATLVLGQADFTSGQGNAGESASQPSLKLPGGLAIVNAALLVADQGNNRMVVYTSH